jgi:hypothetical protein
MATREEIIERFKLEAINIFWEHHRDKMIIRENILKYLNQYYGTKFKSSAPKGELVEKMRELLTVDTLEHFEEHLDRFGLTKNDLRQLLHIGKTKEEKIIDEGKIKQVGTYRLSSEGFTMEFHIMSIKDTIKYFDESEMWVPYV